MRRMRRAVSVYAAPAFFGTEKDNAAQQNHVNQWALFNRSCTGNHSRRRFGFFYDLIE